MRSNSKVMALENLELKLRKVYLDLQHLFLLLLFMLVVVSTNLSTLLYAKHFLHVFMLFFMIMVHGFIALFIGYDVRKIFKLRRKIVVKKREILVSRLAGRELSCGESNG